MTEIISILNQINEKMKNENIKYAYIGKKMKKVLQNEEKEVGLVMINNKEKLLHEGFIFYDENFEKYEKIIDINKEFEYKFDKILENELFILSYNFPL